MKRVNGDKLPTGMYVAKYSTTEATGPDVKTRGSFYKNTNSEFAPSNNHKITSYESNGFSGLYGKENIAHAASRPPLQHQIEITSEGAHPTNLIVPKKGVTLIMKDGAVKKTHDKFNNFPSGAGTK